jgi:hypothetical protein
MPPDFAVSCASAEKPVVVTTTLGMPAFSISVAGRAAAGAQVPQAPLPEITASHPFSFASAAIARARSRCCEGLSLPGVNGNSV